MKDYKWALISVLLVLIAGYMAYSLFLQEWLRQRGRAPQAVEILTPETSIVQRQGAEEMEVTLFFYTPDAFPGQENFLTGEKRQVFQIEDRILLARQIIEELLKGPTVEPEPLAVAPLEEPGPPVEPIYGRVRLRQVYMLDDGTAVVDLSLVTTQATTTGIVGEIALIQSIVRSLRENLPEVERVRFLVSGRPAETLMGHISLSGAFM